jgi:hypothetical protein
MINSALQDEAVRLPESVRRAAAKAVALYAQDQARRKQRQEEIDRAQALMEKVRARETAEMPQARWARWQAETALYQEIADKSKAKSNPVTARLHELDAQCGAIEENAKAAGENDVWEKSPAREILAARREVYNEGPTSADGVV